MRLSIKDRIRIWRNKGYFVFAIIGLALFAFGANLGMLLQKFKDIELQDMASENYNSAMDLYSTCNESLRICSVNLQDDENYITKLKLQCPSEKMPL